MTGPVGIGRDNWIGRHVAIGTPPRVRGLDHAAAHAAAGITTGDRKVVREYVTVDLATGGTPTTIGDDCFLLTDAHVPHDAVLCDGVTLADSAQIGGHTRGATPTGGVVRPVGPARAAHG